MSADLTQTDNSMGTNRVFRCKLCNLKFGKLHALQSHIANSHLRQKRKSCDRAFSTSSVLEMHERSHGSRYYGIDGKSTASLRKARKLTRTDHKKDDERLPECKMDDDSQIERQNRTRRTGNSKRIICRATSPANCEFAKCVVHKPFECELCTHRSETKDNLAMHVKLWHQLPDQPHKFVCPLCTYRSESKEDLVMHVNLSHQESDESHKSSHQESHESHKCGLCPKTFFTKASLRMHLRTHKIQCNTKMFLQRPDEPHKFVCSLCPYRTESKDNLAMHVKLLHQESHESHKCGLCSEKFFTKANLQMHSLRTHKIQHNETHHKPFACAHCPYRCSKEDVLAMHVRLAHHQARNTSIKFVSSSKDSKSHKCEICNKTFLTSAILDLHRRTHNETSGCDIRDKSVGTVTNFELNVRKQPRIDSKPFEHETSGIVVVKEEVEEDDDVMNGTVEESTNLSDIKVQVKLEPDCDEMKFQPAV